LSNHSLAAPILTVMDNATLAPHRAAADALATGLLAAGREGLETVRRAGYEGLVIDAANEIHHTPDLPFAKI
jgi:thiamine biosynthesis lipoprotein ApbE